MANFHLWFLVHLCRLLGFQPGNAYTPGAWFDIREGEYVRTRPAHTACMTQACSQLLDEMLHADVRHLERIALPHTERTEFLNALLVYLGYHLDAVSAVQSVRILKEVF